LRFSVSAQLPSAPAYTVARWSLLPAGLSFPLTQSPPGTLWAFVNREDSLKFRYPLQVFLRRKMKNSIEIKAGVYLTVPKIIFSLPLQLYFFHLLGYVDILILYTPIVPLFCLF
jgi:hypothetical protein